MRALVDIVETIFGERFAKKITVHVAIKYYVALGIRCFS